MKKRVLMGIPTAHVLIYSQSFGSLILVLASG